MSIQLTKEDEELVNRLVQNGRYRDASEAVHEALKRLEIDREDPNWNPLGGPVYPPGSLVHLYADEEENQREARLAEAHPKKLEAF